MNNSPTNSVIGKPEHLFQPGGEPSSLLYPLGRAHATLPSPKFTVSESGSSGHREPSQTTGSYNSLQRFPRALIEIKVPHLTVLPGRVPLTSLSSFPGIIHAGVGLPLKRE